MLVLKSKWWICLLDNLFEKSTGIAILLHESYGWANLTLLSTSAFFSPVFAGCLNWEARDWPVRSGSDLFLFVLMYYKVVLLKMYLAQENIVKSQLAKISRKLWLLLGSKMPWLLHLPSLYEWGYPWRLKVGMERLYYFLQCKPLNWHICWNKGAKNVIHSERVDLVRKPVI